MCVCVCVFSNFYHIFLLFCLHFYPTMWGFFFSFTFHIYFKLSCEWMGKWENSFSEIGKFLSSHLVCAFVVSSSEIEFFLSLISHLKERRWKWQSHEMEKNRCIKEINYIYLKWWNWNRRETFREFYYLIC